ncbi:MscL family protein [Candidatus Microgenomates bacterium]|nr:MscL family protein [Candidatus Microgenomates bacterium]
MIRRSAREIREDLVQTVKEDAQKLEEMASRAAPQAIAKARQSTGEFMDFIRSRGVVALAVGIIIGAAVTELVNSLVADVLNPLLGLVLPDVDRLTESTWHFFEAEIAWGSLAVAFINFLVIALVIFLAFKFLKLDVLDKKKDK